MNKNLRTALVGMSWGVVFLMSRFALEKLGLDAETRRLLLIAFGAIAGGMIVLYVRRNK